MCIPKLWPDCSAARFPRSSLNIKPNPRTTARGTRAMPSRPKAAPAAAQPWHSHPVSPTTSRGSCRPPAAEMRSSAPFFGSVSAISAGANLLEATFGTITVRQLCQRGEQINHTLVKTLQFSLKPSSALMFAPMFFNL